MLKKLIISLSTIKKNILQINVGFLADRNPQGLNCMKIDVDGYTLYKGYSDQKTVHIQKKTPNI